MICWYVAEIPNSYPNKYTQKGCLSVFVTIQIYNSVLILKTLNHHYNITSQTNKIIWKWDEETHLNTYSSPWWNFRKFSSSAFKKRYTRTRAGIVFINCGNVSLEQKWKSFIFCHSFLFHENGMKQSRNFLCRLRYMYVCVIITLK